MGFLGIFKPNLEKMERKRDVPGLIKALRSTEEELREEALRILSRICEEEHLEPLTSALSDGYWRVRAGAAEVMGCVGCDAAAGPLLDHLRDERPEVCMRVAEALGKIDWTPRDDSDRVRFLLLKGSWVELAEMGEAAVEPMMEALGDQDKEVRSTAVRVLGRLGGRRAIDALTRVLEAEKDESIRWNAVLILGGMGEEAIGPLVLAMNDPVWEVRESAATSLANMGEAAFQPLLRALESPHGYTRSRAASALGKMGDPRALGPIITLLGDRTDFVRWNAAEALGEIGDPAAAGPLGRTLLDKDRGIQWQATLALGKMGEPGVQVLLRALEADGAYTRQDLIAALADLGEMRAVGLIVSALGSATKEVRWNAIIALGKLGDLSAVGPLAEFLADKDESFRGNAAKALGEIRDPSAVPFLLGALKDREPSVRGFVAEALGMIGDHA
ncbi:hypothetical protein E2P65_04195, partial [Candidatus Bathyarchaeota archaeon]